MISLVGGSGQGVVTPRAIERAEEPFAFSSATYRGSRDARRPSHRETRAGSEGAKHPSENGRSNVYESDRHGRASSDERRRYGYTEKRSDRYGIPFERQANGKLHGRYRGPA